MNLNTNNLIAFCAVLCVGVGGALGAFALGADELASLILAFSGGLLVPTGSVLAATKTEAK